ncbi:GNAT family N-acetyltransferase [Exiguobacterium flavidum]|uniref:GNAT family N-acetyltransferase n=1 Tax=Exiguobacterium flavidum TaxID=2184695 RepID=UPI000DF778F4|nr:GNAT family N-acetyltransferase [Exiguobacterium flavidum]
MIRQATTGDVKAIALLIREKAEALRDRGSTQWRKYLQLDLEQVVRDDMTTGTVHVFEKEGRIVGAGSLLPSLDWDAALWDDSDGRYIHRLVVSDGAKGEQVGSKMMLHLIEMAGPEKLRLDCVESNEFLNGYYPGFGFDRVGEKDGFSLFELKTKEHALTIEGGRETCN